MPDENDLEYAIIYRRDVGDGREIYVQQRWYNTILVIGPKGGPFYDTHW